MKRCTKCGEEKELSEFEINKKRADGTGARCKKCAALIRNAYRPSSFAGIPKTKRRKTSNRQTMVAKYGIAVVDALESLGPY